ncbi:MAG: hypothetical protein WB801_01705, partial [Candidatus Dormiibacterota bacterium]
VIVLQADRTRRRISLSYRQLLPRPAHLPPEEAGGGDGYAAVADYEPDADDDEIAESPPKPKRTRAKAAVKDVADQEETAITDDTSGKPDGEAAAETPLDAGGTASLEEEEEADAAADAAVEQSVKVDDDSASTVEPAPEDRPATEQNAEPAESGEA